MLQLDQSVIPADEGLIEEGVPGLLVHRQLPVVQQTRDVAREEVEDGASLRANQELAELLGRPEVPVDDFVAADGGEGLHGLAFGVCERARRGLWVQGAVLLVRILVGAP
eukprot:CAMPEP_0175316590 /NCGR_PEP_ID=MMETSP0093-20121207/69491_1 /TAXON_ID=311494 /ORGANISM="Alexandrium monilatum, Strain CCMP3105" /LENGTH=109 /DNA_ID=CAMNT_0016613359 /DNA_START=97 /DNA_END=426 /DNA_ORIENTATION=+